eukprot:6424983-Prorocentrum_lima.AAC.1
MCLDEVDGSAVGVAERRRVGALGGVGKEGARWVGVVGVVGEGGGKGSVDGPFVPAIRVTAMLKLV